MTFDTETIGIDDARKTAETACAFANSSGGVLIFVDCDYSSLIPNELPRIFEAEERVYIPPLSWREKPFALNGRVYRRIEGQNVISGAWAKSLMAMDSNEASRDDIPVDDVRLNENSLNEFRERVIELNADMKCLSLDEFLRRCGIFSGKWLTLAGALMLGDVVRVHAVLDYEGGHAEVESANIWDAYRNILPRLTRPLSAKCSEAFRALFINSLLHSDYNIDKKINVTITSSPPKVLFDNPGTIRGIIRNHRLKKMFALLGENSHSLKTVKNFMPSFELTQDMLNFRVYSLLTLEGLSTLPQPVML